MLVPGALGKERFWKYDVHGKQIKQTEHFWRASIRGNGLYQSQADFQIFSFKYFVLLYNILASVWFQLFLWMEFKFRLPWKSVIVGKWVRWWQHLGSSKRWGAGSGETIKYTALTTLSIWYCDVWCFQRLMFSTCSCKTSGRMWYFTISISQFLIFHKYLPQQDTTRAIEMSSPPMATKCIQNVDQVSQMAGRFTSKHCHTLVRSVESIAECCTGRILQSSHHMSISL